MRFLSILHERKAGIYHRHFVYNDPSSPQRNPYAQFDDRDYEMGDVRSTTNLTAGLSGGAPESMSDFYDEVIPCPPLSIPFACYHVLPTPAHPYHPLSNPDNPLKLISDTLDLLHPNELETVQR